MRIATREIITQQGVLVIWSLNDKVHRDDDHDGKSLPAMIATLSEGVASYFYRYGQLHNRKGPAITRLNGKVAYFLHDKELTFKQWQRRVKVWIK